MQQLITRWGQQPAPGIPLPEYPRPQLCRDSFFNLNGLWEYAIDEEPFASILVPFSPETLLSGVGRVLAPGQCLHYRRRFTLPESFVQGRVLLHFGAVDQTCTVSLNGVPLGSHEGGYLAFCFDITEALKPGENELTLTVRDDTEHAPYARGKQKFEKLKGRMSYLFYTPQSGIWKTVWLESVPAVHVRGLHIDPDPDHERVSFTIDADPAGQQMALAILDGKQVVWHTEGPAAARVTAPLPNAVLWTPDRPFLYDVVLRWGDDIVSSYFGMRTLSIEEDKKGILRFCLNHEPIFFNGVLDQGYWPESLLTPPSDEALQYDIRKLKQMGYNTIRKHIKIESDRFYYHCDRLGMLVWQDMPNGGSSYNMAFVTYLPTVLPWAGRHISDHHYRLFGRADEAGRAQFIRELRGMLDQLYDHPCIALWTTFNEGWGQFDARSITTIVRAHGGDRFINEACGWYDQGGGDLYSIHNYFRKLKVRPQLGRVVALSEYGGYAYPVTGHMACAKKVGYKNYASRQKLQTSYAALLHDQVIPALANGLCAAIYTQTSDIEEEINGLMTYDRAVDKLDPDALNRLHQNLYHKFRQAVE